MSHLASAFHSSVLFRFFASLIVLSVPLAGTATAQVSPIGGHHFRANGGPSGAGGGGAGAVPIEFPPSRSNLPVPLAVVHTGAPTAGAAGVGWDVPLSFVRVSTSVSRRKPSVGVGAPTRLMMTLNGASTLMVPTDVSGRFASISGAKSMELVSVGDSYEAFDPSGNRYVFTAAPDLDDALNDAGLYLLEEIHDATGTDKVVIEYQVKADGCHSGAPELSISRIRHTPRADGDTFLHQIDLHYDTRSGTACTDTSDLVGVAVDAGALYGRSQLLERVRVSSRNNLTATSGLVVLREYAFTYGDDADSGAPRLIAVDVYGEGGQAGGGAALPVAGYGYGALTNGDAIRFGSDAVAVPRFDGGAEMRASLTRSKSSTFQWPLSPTVYEGVETTQVIRDFTGDGVADVVYEHGGTLWLLPNYTERSGSSLTARRPLGVDALLGAELIRSTPGEPTTSQTWTKLLDWNADGRVDLLDATTGIDDNHWTLWLNTPVAGDEFGIEWQKRDVNVAHIRAYHADQGFETDGLMAERLPISRKRTWSNDGLLVCQRWEPGSPGELYEETDCVPDQEAYDRFRASAISASGGAKTETVTEWDVLDINGDGYPDIVTNSQPLGPSKGDESVDCVTYDLEGEPTDRLVTERPTWTVSDPGTPVELRCMHRVRLSFDTPGQSWNQLRVFYNHTGPRFPNAFREDQLYASDANTCGVEKWRAGPDAALMTVDPGSQLIGDSWQSCGFVDWNGDGIVDRIGAGIGSGEGGWGAGHVGGLIAYSNNRHETCGRDDGWTGEFEVRQTAGLLDLTADGLPDRVYSRGDSWWVRPNLGHRFGPERRIEGAFELSLSTGYCHEDATVTHAAYDINGDGRPEIITVDGAGNLNARALLAADGTTNTYGAARLERVSNGHGAHTVFEYTSAKAQLRERLDLPGPEIVLASVRTDVDGGDSIDRERYAYGDAQLRYDPVMHRWSTPGYARRVTMSGVEQVVDHHGTSGVEVRGVVTIQDAYISDRYDAGFSDLLLNGKPTATYQLEGEFDPDPWAFVLPDPAGHSSLRAGGTSTYAVTAVTDSIATPWIGSAHEAWIGDCADVDPYAVGGIVSDPRLCGHTGVAYLQRSSAWRGRFAAPASSDNVEIGTEVLAVDSLARPTRIWHKNDTRIGQDDVCVDLTYATPVAGSHVYNAVATRRVTSCGGHDDVGPGDEGTYAGERYVYDGKSPGLVGEGLVTRVYKERYDVQSGQSIDEHLAAEIAYGGNDFAQPSFISRTRTNPPGSPTPTTTTTTALAYDPYGYSVASETSETSDAASLTTVTQHPQWPTEKLTSTDPNGVTSVTHRDRFGRPTQQVVEVGGASHDLAVIFYQDTGARSTRTTLLRAGEAPLETIEHVDPLGRARYAEQLLGTDYAGVRVIRGAGHYDGAGRMAFVADPFETSDPVPSTVDGTRYGTTFTYTAAGEPRNEVRGWGYHPSAERSNPADELFVSTRRTSYDNGVRIVQTRGPNELTTGHVADGTVNIAELTAIGRLMEVRRENGTTVLSRTAYGQDRLGNTNEVIRYAEPQAPAQAQVMTAHHDSFGQRLQLSEPGTSTKYFSYDEWGDLTESSWADGANTRYDRAQYDGYGRLVNRELARVSSLGDTTVESHSRYFYDVHSGSEHQLAGGLLGRMSHAQEDDVMETFFSYDAYGRPSKEARVSLVDELGRPFSTTRERDTSGRLRTLRMQTRDTDDVVTYSYDSADRVSRVDWDGLGDGATLFDAQEIDALGRYRSVTYGNRVTGTWDYHANGRQLLASERVAGPFGDHTRSYPLHDSEGRVTLRTDDFWGGSGMRAWPAVSNFRYDRLDELVGIDGFDVGTSSYTYDGVGNVIALSEPGSDSVALEYDPVDRERVAMRTIGSTERAYSYDEAGSVTRIAPEGFVMWAESFYFGYDSASRAVRASRAIGFGSTSATIKWDATGGVASIDMTSGGGWSASNTLMSERRYGDLLVERYVADTDEYQVERTVPGPLGDLAVLRTSNSTSSVLYPHGTARGRLLATDQDGELVQRVTYAGYGTVTEDTGDTGSFDYSRTQWNHGTSLSELGVVLLGPRFYHPTTGRFLQRDPLIHTVGPGGNPYAFANNDPINFSDPSGLSPTCDPLAPQCGGLTGAGGLLAGAVGTALNAAAGLIDWGGGSGGGPTPPTVSPVTSGQVFQHLQQNPIVSSGLWWADGYDAVADGASASWAGLNYGVGWTEYQLRRPLWWLLRQAEKVEDGLCGKGTGCIGAQPHLAAVGGLTRVLRIGGRFLLGTKKSYDSGRAATQGSRRLPRSLGAAAADSDNVVRIGGEPWRIFKVGEAACQSGCGAVARDIQRIVGGRIARIHADDLALGGIADIGGTTFRNPAGLGRAWFHHVVVVKNGRVYDALTGPQGQLIDAYRARWQYGDVLKFDF